MLDRLGRLWRIVATAVCFLTFGLGGLLMRLAVYPLLSLFVRESHRRMLFSRWIIHHAFRLFVRLMMAVGVISVEVHGAHRLRHRRGMLVLANHPSLIDVVFLISLIECADCVVKGGLARNAFTRGPIRAAGFVRNDAGVELVSDCIASVRAGSNLIIFPEGTRTPLNGKARLQRGAANIAVRGAIDITPVRISCSPPVLTKGVGWYHVPPRRAHFCIEICDDIRIDRFVSGDCGEALAARRLTDHLTDYFFLEPCRAAS